jgi:hypothetical protein
VNVVFLATDALGPTSNTYLMKAQQKTVSRRLLNKFVISFLETKGIAVVMSDHTKISAQTPQHGTAAFERLQLSAAINDLLVCVSAKNFLHMYGSTGPGADAIEGCEGARAGSCFGNWILNTRQFYRSKSEMLSVHAPSL